MSETSPDRQPPHQASTLLGAMALADAPHRLTDPQTFSAPSATTWDSAELIAHTAPTLAAALRLLWADQGEAGNPAGALAPHGPSADGAASSARMPSNRRRRASCKASASSRP